MKLNHSIYPLLMGMAILMFPSCVREDLLREEENVIPGLETTISLKVNVPRMDVATRADMVKGTDSEINSLWVGIFSATSGECTYAGLFNNPALSNIHGNENENFLTLTIPTQSGPSYIVAVGNPKGNIGYQYIKSSPDPVKATPLDELLPGSADVANNPTSGPKFTWETYKNIAISRHSIGNVVDDPTGNLPMSGIYYSSPNDHGQNGNDNPTPAGWEDANETPVVIPVVTPGTTGELEGAIHLRRLISHVTFNIRAENYPDIADPEGNDSKKGARIVSIVPQAYQIINAPFTSWLHERKTQVGADPATNSGDVISINYDGRFYSESSTNSNLKLYRPSPYFRGNQSITSNSDGSFSFDFWMLENKRRALNDNIGYDAREKERKYIAGEERDQNTGIYTALCGEDGNETMNNLATFVVIWCKIEYTEAGIGALKGGNYDDVIERTADAYYTIHLGGVKRTDADDYDWSDFAHRRNHQYTYNVKVVDVDRIIVEAKGDETKEDRPGIEGVVSDIRMTYDLDAHYGVFNIALSNKERTGGYPGTLCPFRLEVYYNDERIIIDQNNFHEFSKNDNSNKSAKLWQWIEFRPTSGADVLAEYKPYHKKGSDGQYINESGFDYGDNRTFRLNEIADIQSFPGVGDNATDPTDNTRRYYTVFVNEYVYEDGNQNDGSERNIYDETTNNWVNYVNQPPRTCWLNIAGEDVSQDKESVYIKSEYIITQKSIQTFYDIPRIDANNPNVNAIGLEYLNETYGLTLDWRYSDGTEWTGKDYGVPNQSYSLDNGKLNQMRYLRATWNVDNTNQIDWSKYLNQSEIQKITDINKDSYQYNVSGLKDGITYYVPAIFTFYSWNTSRHSPNNHYVVTAMNACMNRNRDNNGNGKIDPEEIRWYLPSSGEMVDLVNGRNSLEEPLMDYGSNMILYTPSPSASDPHHVNTRFHYISSNKRLLWAEEGVTINSVGNDVESSWNRIGWQLRCTRSLGTDLTKSDTQLDPAFTVDYNPGDQSVVNVYPTYFEEQTLREPQYKELPPHSEMSKSNRISTSGFAFKKELLRGVSYRYTDAELGKLKDRSQHDKTIIEGNTLCRNTYGQGWRMPNIKEVAVIKLALNRAPGLEDLGNWSPSAGIYNQFPSNEILTQGGYQIGNFFACTYREYGLNPVSVSGYDVARADVDPTGYYLGVVYENGQEGHLGRAQCLTTAGYEGVGTNIRYFVRCVKDL